MHWPTLLAASISEGLIVYGIVLLVIGMFMILAQAWYRRTYGRITSNDQIIINFSAFVLSLLIAVPILLVFFDDDKPSSRSRGSSDGQQPLTLNEQFRPHNSLSEETKRKIDRTIRLQQEAENERRQMLGLGPLYRPTREPLSP